MLSVTYDTDFDLAELSVVDKSSFAIRISSIYDIVGLVGWWFGLAVTRWSWSTKLLYARPG